MTKTDWAIQGRRLAMEKERHDFGIELADIPPISALSTVQFEVIGSPEVNQASHHARLMRWVYICNTSLF